MNLNRRSLYLAVGLGFVIIYALGLVAIWSNQWVVGLGDCTIRAVSALTDKLQISMLWSEVGLRSPWPKGHTFLIGGIIQWLAAGGDSFYAIHWYQTLSWTAYLSGILLFTLSALKIFGKESALVALAVFIGFGAAMTEAANGMTEIFVLFLSASSTYCLVTALKSSNRVWLIYFAGMFNLAASTMRTEIIIVAFVQWLLLVDKTKVLHVLLFGVLSSGFFLVRLIFSTAIYDGPVTFLNSNKTFFSPDAVNKTRVMGECLWDNAGLAMVLVGVYLVLASYARSRGGVEIERDDTYPAKKMNRFLAVLKSVNSLELFPVRCLVILFLFMFEGLRSGNLEANERYWIALMPYISLTAAAAFSLRPASFGIPLAGLRAVIIGALFLAGIYTAYSRWETRNVFQAGEPEFIKWLSARKESCAVFDVMNYRDGRYILYACSASKAPRFWGRGVTNPLEIKVKKLKSNDPVADRGFKTEALAHATLCDARTKYLILPSKEYFQDVLRMHEKSGKRNEAVSYFKKDLENVSDDSIRFKSPLIKNSEKIELTRVYANSYVEVFEKM